jgi:hypothetical protein
MTAGSESTARRETGGGRPEPGRPPPTIKPGYWANTENSYSEYPY